LSQTLHHTIRMRLDNIRSVKVWIEGRSPEELRSKTYQKAILRKIQLQLGVTRRKALEYMRLAFSEEIELS